MIVRTSLIALALAAVAGTAFAAPADGTSPAKAPATKSASHKGTCEKRSAAGHCEKWATSTKTAAKPDAAAKPAK